MKGSKPRVRALVLSLQLKHVRFIPCGPIPKKDWLIFLLWRLDYAGVVPAYIVYRRHETAVPEEGILVTDYLFVKAGTVDS